MRSRILPVFISFAGCTSRCIYCNQHKITGIKHTSIIESVKSQIREQLSYGLKYDELAYYGGSFSCLSDDIRSKLYKIAKETGISSVRFSTSPDCINENIITEATKNGVKVIELGVQSLDDSVLRYNKRPYNREICLTAIKILQKNIETTGVQLMVGMAKESVESFYESVNTLASIKPDYARIYPTVVLEDSELADLYKSGDYKPITMAESVSRATYGYITFEANGCKVIRVGLHDSEDVKTSSIAGAYHPAMGDLVKTVALAVFYNSGQTLQIDRKYLNVAYGYASALKDMANVEICDGTKPDFSKICKIISEENSENYQRKIQEQADYFAERLISQTDNR